MEEGVTVASPRYRQVAADIAAKIVEGKYRIGDKVYARSLIASQYAVSSETARRAIAILSEVGIVETTRGSGVVIRSYENALLFVDRCREVDTLATCKRAVMQLADRLVKEGMELKERVSRLVERTDQFRSTNPFEPFEVTVECDSTCIGRSLSQLRFWHNTGVTVVAIRRGEILTLSPGPYEVLREGDVVYFIGDGDSSERVARFLHEEQWDPLSV